MIFDLQSKGEKNLKLSAWVKVYFDRITNASNPPWLNNFLV